MHFPKQPHRYALILYLQNEKSPGLNSSLFPDSLWAAHLDIDVQNKTFECKMHSTGSKAQIPCYMRVETKVYYFLLFRDSWDGYRRECIQNLL